MVQAICPNNIIKISRKEYVDVVEHKYVKHFPSKHMQ